MNEDELREHQERLHQIREMMKQPAWALLVGYCATAIDARKRKLLGGYAPSIEDYRAEAGWIQGATFVLDAPDRLDQELALQLQIKAEFEAAANL